MWLCFWVAGSNVGSMKDIIGILTWIGDVKAIIWPVWASMVKVPLLMICIWWSKWCCVICISSVLSSLVHAVCKMTVSTICVSCIRYTMWHLLKPVCPIGMCCWRTWCFQCFCSAIYFLHCVGSIFIWIDICCCWSLKLNTSFNISRISFIKL